MQRPDDGSLIIQDARIIWRNFAGRETPYNAAGDRNFCLILPEDVAEKMAADGWFIKRTRSREEDVPGDPYVEVRVAFGDYKPAVVYLVTSKGRTLLDEELVELVDQVDIATIDLAIRPYHWKVGGKTGVKAYLKKAFVTVYEDELDEKYADLEDLSQLPMRAGRVDE